MPASAKVSPHQREATMTISSVPALWAIAARETVTTFGPAATPAALPKTTRMVAITATHHPHVVGIPVSWGPP
jgi:hypothetical protein